MASHRFGANKNPYSTNSLSFGGLPRTGGRLSVTPLPAFATGSARAVDLLVGRDLLGGEALDIDYAQHRFRLGTLRLQRSQDASAVSRRGTFGAVELWIAINAQVDMYE